MSHVRAIAEVPTSDDPTVPPRQSIFDHWSSSEVKINTIEMIGVADPDGELSERSVEGRVRSRHGDYRTAFDIGRALRLSCIKQFTRRQNLRQNFLMRTMHRVRHDESVAHTT